MGIIVERGEMMDKKEIDILIAEKVMGFKLFTATKEQTAIVGGSRVSWGTWVETGRVDEWGPVVVEIKRYSAELLAAYEAAEKLSERFECDVSLDNISERHRGGRPKYTVRVSGGTLEYENPSCLFSVSNDVAPMAICLAALKAVGAEVHSDTLAPEK